MEASEPLLNDFESDEHRRVLANLSHPRTVLDLIRFLSRHDPDNTSLARTEDGAKLILGDLEEEGLVVNLGPRGAGASGEVLVNAAAEHADALTLPKEKAEAYVERVDDPDRPPFIAEDEDAYVMSELGLAKLQAPSPDEKPPLEGRALELAERANEKLREEYAAIEREGKRELARQYREAADRLEAEAQELEQ